MLRAGRYLLPALRAAPRPCAEQLRRATGHAREPYQLEFDEIVALQEAVERACGGSVLMGSVTHRVGALPPGPLTVSFERGGSVHTVAVEHKKHLSGADAFVVLK
eukprot:TRINITY_DN4914_c0_g2_i1.p3 TRINITY_DN4914_c0_g2~~TRINITY_DN4914_c0_g2_i1.p3  ORF type:complete len:121 (+),score=41.36 TRINITY_DN4914_c0_g2_i1:50-364(+)